MSVRLVPIAVVVGSVLLSASPGAAPGALSRSTVDRADEVSGPQIHALYVLPSDGADRALDTDGTIAASVANWQAWFRGQTGGDGLRLDTSGGELDVTFVRLRRTEAELAARGIFLRDAIEEELRAAGLLRPDKVYATYYDGSSTAACGGGAWPPTLPGAVAAVYMRATYGQGFLCYEPERSRGGLQIMDFAVLHEVLHTMGFVPTCAEHHTRAGHVSDSPTDIMYAGDEQWQPAVLDVGRDDYYHAHILGCRELAESAFLEPGHGNGQRAPHGGGHGAGSGRQRPPRHLVSSPVLVDLHERNTPHAACCPWEGRAFRRLVRSVPRYEAVPDHPRREPHGASWFPAVRPAHHSRQGGPLRTRGRSCP